MLDLCHESHSRKRTLCIVYLILQNFTSTGLSDTELELGMWHAIWICTVKRFSTKGRSDIPLIFILIFQQRINLQTFFHHHFSTVNLSAYYEHCKITLTSRTLLFSEVYTTLNCLWFPTRNKNYFKGVKSLYILWLSKELKWASELEWCCSTRHWDISYTYIVSSAMKMKTSWIFQNLLGLEV